MRVSVATSDIKLLANEIEGDIAGAATTAMREAASSVKQELRDQVTSAGLGNRLANTWRGETYPKSARSVNPAGYIWSNAPDIVDSYVRGATITPINGSRYLAIPTKNVPLRRGGRGGKKRMTPVEVQAEFDQELFFKREFGPRGRVFAFVNRIRGRAGKKAAQPLLMFVLVPSVRKPKLLDLNGPAERGAAMFEQAVVRRLAAL